MSSVRFLSQLPVAETRSSCQRESLLAERPRDRLRRWNGVSSRRDMVPLLSSNQGHGEIRHKSRSIPHQDERRVRWPKGEKSKRSRNISAADWPSTHWCAGRKITTVTHPKVMTRRSRLEPVVKHRRVQWILVRYGTACQGQGTHGPAASAGAASTTPSRHSLIIHSSSRSLLSLSINSPSLQLFDRLKGTLVYFLRSCLVFSTFWVADCFSDSRLVVLTPDLFWYRGLCVGSHRGRFSRRTVVRVTSPSIYVSSTSINPVAIPLVVADCQRPLRAPSERAV